MVDEHIDVGAQRLDVVPAQEKKNKDRYSLSRSGTNAKTAGSAASNMILSLGSAEVTAEITSVRQARTFSVIPSLSIMIICRACQWRPTLADRNCNTHRLRLAGRYLHGR